MENCTYDPGIEDQISRNDEVCAEHRETFDLSGEPEEDCYLEACYVGCPFLGSDEGCG